MDQRWIEEPMYTKIKQLMPLPCVDLLVTNKGSLLLTLRNNEPGKDLWFTPGGRIFKDETLEEAVKRVLSMETGLQPINITQISTTSHIWPIANTVTTYNRVEVNTDKVKPDEQHREYRWINKMEDDLHPYLAEMIKNTGLLR
ncbi:MAG: NUDIX domain-containing protein [Deltaproteobacteria bacterium]|nr:NUDIX domain-containing protein [Deltaproteobacteria bacterium]